MQIGTGLNTGDIHDFNLMPAENMVRLVKWVGGLRHSANPNYWNDNPALARVARFMDAHLNDWNVWVGNCRWSTLGALFASVRNYGPPCSEDDIRAAIAMLPSPSTSANGHLFDQVIEQKLVAGE